MEIVANNWNEGLRVHLLRPKFEVGDRVWFLLQGRPVEGIVTAYRIDVLYTGKVEAYAYKVGYVGVSQEGPQPSFAVITDEGLKKTKEEITEVILKSIEDATLAMPDEFVPLFQDFIEGQGEKA